jgi:GTPase SAR1 family protein
MGCVNGKDRNEQEEEEYNRNKTLKKTMKTQQKEDQKQVKIILLGAGDSGKSTFCKQMKVNYKNGFSHTELLYYQGVLRSNCLLSMQRAIDEIKELGKLPEKLKNVAACIEEAKDLTEEVAENVIKAWESKEISNFIAKELYRLQIPSCAPYYFDNAVRFSKENYKPSDDDILRAKLRTTGITETKFLVCEIEFIMVDVGGQRAERRKWLHCFDGVQAVIFLAALDEYNMTLQEDNETNRLEESLKLFSDITGSQWFGNKSLILFLNKSDIFHDKIKKYPLDKIEAFKADLGDLGDPSDEEEYFKKSVAYISSKYENVYKESGRSKLYPFITNALDTTGCKKVFDAIRDTVISSSLTYAGFS